MLSSFSTGVLFQVAPSVGKPWQENWAIDAIAIGTAIFMVVAVWLWARSGRSKADNEVPFDHTAENFAGTVFAGYGPLPIFLVMMYAIIFIAILLYTIISISTGPQY